MSDWPLVVVKELSDNALDACEETGVAPVISVTVNEAGTNEHGCAVFSYAGLGEVLDHRLLPDVIYCAVNAEGHLCLRSSGKIT